MVSAKTRAIVWARGAGRCYFCNKLLIGDYYSGNEDGNFGFIAHIVSDKLGGPRGDPVRSTRLADDPANLMLMCYPHHKLIDVDELSNYPEQLLLEMKAAHERRIEILTEAGPDRQSHALRYGAKIGVQESLVNFASVRSAMLPKRYPADGRSIGIEIIGSAATDGEESFWKNEPDNLRRQFDKGVRERIALREISHLSVFALGPMPLLIELGRLLGDIVPADVYQLHREPPGWAWAESGPHVEFRITRPAERRSVVALKMGISATITDQRITDAVGTDTSIWSLAAVQPGNDVMRYQADLAAFRRAMRGLYDEIKALHGEGVTIHLFPAVPVSVAIEVGRVRMPKVDLPLLVYDQVAGSGFVARLQIG